MAKRCPICRSKQWRKEQSTGMIVCSEGHVLQNYRNETNEQTDAPGHALKRLKLKSSRKKKAKLSRADPNLYHGARSTYLYFQCLQLILRKQVAVLTTLWQLPPEFEVVCRDVWALNLASLPEPPPPEPYLHAAGESAPAPPDADTQHSKPPSDAGAESEDGDDSESQDEEDETEAAIRKLMEGVSESEDESDDGDKEANVETKRSARAEKRRKRDRTYYHIPAGNIAVLVIACWLLRVPVTYMDFVRLIDMYTLPYLEGTRYLPPEMVKHIARHTEQMLSPRFAPKPPLLHILTERLAGKLYTQNGVSVPEFNGAPVLWRAVKALSGSPTLYCLAKVVGYTCSLPLTLHPKITPQLTQTRRTDPKSHKSDNVAPELALVASAIVALKMVYGLDGLERVPTSTEDPAAALPKIDDYIQAVKAQEESQQKTREQLFSASSNASVLEFDPKAAAQYLDFCEKALLDGDASKESAILSTYFPLGRQGSDEPTGGVGEEEAKNDAGNAMEAGGVDENSMLVPGSMLKVYRGTDITGLMPPDYDVVLGAAARWTGFETDAVAVVVERYERRLVRWWRERTAGGMA
ncbi:hypothetical protein AURDEDRAFT_141641 [Auricularia subglabra TFB-10046 SS5]|nr:hypothetical protein AURDEDRAFT_141641 [Auricularia subglabra TFB-10046 SS5]